MLGFCYLYDVEIRIENIDSEPFQFKPNREIFETKLTENGRNHQSELVLLVSPRNPKVSSCDFTNSRMQAANFLNVIDKLCYPSIIKDEGWRRMPSIMKIIDILGLDGLF